MNPTMIPDLAVTSLALAGIYMLVALSWVIIFRATQVLNFATGQFMLLGTFLYYFLLVKLGAPVWLSAIGVLVLAGLIGMAAYAILLRPVAGQPIFSQIMLTMGLAILLLSTVGIVWGYGPRQLPEPFPLEVFRVGGFVNVSSLRGVTILIGLVSLLLILSFLRFSRMGIQMRAAAEKPLLASQMGININLAFGLSWAIAGMAVTLAGIAYSHTNILNTSLVELGLRGLSPALIGGLDSVRGVAVGALIVALVERMTVVILGGGAADAAAFTVLLIMLAIRPYGLFGTPEIRRV